MPVTVIVRSGALPKSGAMPPTSATQLSITCDAPLVVIGRGEGCDVRLPDPSVSHRHATIRQRGHEYILIDEGSANGTFIGNVKLGAQAPRILKHCDLARIGRVWLEIRFDNQVPPAQAQLATKELALALVARALDAQGELGGPRIVVTDGPDRGKSLCLDEPGRIYLLGRGREVDLVLEDSDASRRHVQVLRRADQLVVRDLGSKNGAELAGERLAPRDQPWRLDQELRIGKNVFAYRHPAIEALGELERAADEKIREGESIAPPEPTAPSAADRTSNESSAKGGAAYPSNGTGHELGGAAPIAELPRRAAASRPRKLGWTSTDFVVVLLAIGVLALSVIGLFWLLKG
ncbi:MAG TPA: FHA domain-containing protein [Polyangiaceae bacterium]|jgi:pSer/pThr/pTyr-binding forkhead associated (FHA) protein|nr:FHA domain-containing protein [Polyangiaceae bacterium]